MVKSIEILCVDTNKIGIEDSYQILNDVNLSLTQRVLFNKSNNKAIERTAKNILMKEDKIKQMKVNFLTVVENSFASENKYKYFLSSIKKQRRTLKNNTLRGANQINKQRTIIRDEIASLTAKNNNEIGIALNQISKTTRKLSKDVAKMFDMLPSKTPPVIINPAPVITSVTHKPPFNNMTPYSKTINWLMDNYTSSQYSTVDPQNGHVWQSSTLNNDDADNWDPAFVESEAGFSFLYTTQATGKIKIILKAQPWRSDHICSLSDEFGFSDSSVYQYQRLGAHIIDADGTDTHTQMKSDWWEEGYRNGSWNESYLSSSATYTTIWTSAKSYNKGTDVLINVFSLLQNLPSVNDVSVSSKIDFYWYFKEISVGKA